MVTSSHSGVRGERPDPRDTTRPRATRARTALGVQPGLRPGRAAPEQDLVARHPRRRPDRPHRTGADPTIRPRASRHPAAPLGELLPQPVAEPSRCTRASGRSPRGGGRDPGGAPTDRTERAGQGPPPRGEAATRGTQTRPRPPPHTGGLSRSHPGRGEVVAQAGGRRRVPGRAPPNRSRPLDTIPTRSRSRSLSADGRCRPAHPLGSTTPPDRRAAARPRGGGMPGTGPPSR